MFPLEDCGLAIHSEHPPVDPAVKMGTYHPGFWGKKLSESGGISQ